MAKPKLISTTAAYRRSQGEAVIQQLGQSLATLYGWKWIHISDARRVNKHGTAYGDRNVAGFPDLLCIRGERMVVIEFKRAGQKPRANQDDWLALFKAAGAEAYVMEVGDDDWLDEVLRP